MSVPEQFSTLAAPAYLPGKFGLTKSSVGSSYPLFL